MFTLLRMTGLDAVLTPAERTGAFFAAYCHDLEHVGYSNNWLRNTQHEWAAGREQGLGCLPNRACFASRAP